MPTATRLTPEDWTAAALAAMADSGLAAVAVEPLARGLGATKGSFYWHFANRDALIEAALVRWEQEGTEDVIAWVEATEQAPRERLRLLWAGAVGMAQEDNVESAVLAGATHPLVAPVLDRVTQRRIGYLAGLFAALDFTPTQARDRGLLAYTAYLGHLQLIRAGLAVPADASTLERYVDRMLEVVLAD